MVISLVVALAVAATPAPDPKLAAPGLSGLNLTKDEVDFYSEHFATQFTFEGVKVTTASQIGAVVGLEREKSLMGCTDNGSCMTELANALGVDGILTGSIAKIEDAYQLNLKIVSADDASNLATYSSQVSGQKNLVNELTRAAKVMAKLMKEKLRARREQSALAANQAAGATSKPGAQAATQPAAQSSSGPQQAGGVATTAGGTSASSSATPTAPGSEVSVSSTVTPGAPRKDPRRNRVTLGPLPILFGAFPVEFEHAVSPGTSIALGASLSFPALLALIGEPQLGIGGSLELRFFPGQAPAPSGFWIGPQFVASYSAGYVVVAATDTTPEQTVPKTDANVGMHLMAGYTFISDGGFTLSGGAGLGARYYFETVSQNAGPAFSGAIHFNIGYAF